MENEAVTYWLPVVEVIMMDTGEARGRKADIYQAIFKYPCWSS